MRTHLRLLAVLVTVALTAGCGATFSDDDPNAATPASPASTTPGGATPTPTSSSPPTLPPPGESTPPGASVPAGLREQPRVAAAIADSATREGVDPVQVVVAAWSPVTWNDGSLGCPEPGMAYTQATVEGELLILRVAGGLFQYHARAGGPFAYCDEPSAGYVVG
jgi:hypothetical protein